MDGFTCNLKTYRTLKGLTQGGAGGHCGGPAGNRHAAGKGPIQSVAEAGGGYLPGSGRAD